MRREHQRHLVRDTDWAMARMPPSSANLLLLAQPAMNTGSTPSAPMASR